MRHEAASAASPRIAQRAGRGRAGVGACGVLGVGDIFRFLSFWFSQSPLADFSADDEVTLQDLFDFLAAYFRGCP